jgi:hypothetical protein
MIQIRSEIRYNRKYEFEFEFTEILLNMDPHMDLINF